jgi:hypothetical protein
MSPTVPAGSSVKIHPCTRQRSVKEEYMDQSTEPVDKAVNNLTAQGPNIPWILLFCKLPKKKAMPDGIKPRLGRIFGETAFAYAFTLIFRVLPNSPEAL